MTEVVRYLSGSDDVEVGFEIDPPEGYRPVGAGPVEVRVRDAVQPALDAARDVLGRLRELQPDEVEVRFAIKVSGSANWLVARATSEGNFEVTLRWRSTSSAEGTASVAGPTGTTIPETEPDPGRTVPEVEQSAA